MGIIDDIIAAWDKIEPYVSPYLTESNMWLGISIIATLTVVQGFKAVLKHYSEPYIEAGKFTKFTRQLILFGGAFLIGVGMVLWLVDKPDVGKWAGIVGIMNPIFYMGLLALAEHKKWIRFVAILKMRNVVKVVNEETGEEELEVEQTIFMTPTKRAEILSKEIKKVKKKKK